MAKATPIENVSEITDDYIERVLKGHYSGNLTKQLTPLMIKTLAFDYKQKARNLDWLFKGKTTITITPDPEVILKNAMKEDSYGIRTLSSFLDSIGATFSGETLQDGKCNYKNQSMRISRVISNTGSTDLVKAVLAKDSYSGNIIIRNIGRNDLYTYNPETDTVSTGDIRRSKKSTDLTDGEHFWYRNSAGYYECATVEQAEMKVKRAIDDIHLQECLSQLDAGTVIMSIEINDFITASSGGVSSCFGFGGMHHMGWINYFRADFGIMVYMQNREDRFSKVGRQWLLMKMTENGEDFEAPAYKFQKPYGRIQKSHTNLVNAYVLAAIKDKWGYKEKDFEKITSGNISHCSVSDTCLQRDGSHSRHSGYTDTGFGDSAYGMQLKEGTAYKGQYMAFPYVSQHSSRQQNGRSLIFNFPDALDMSGQPTNSGNFESHQNSRTDSPTGYIPPYKVVTCSVSGESVLNAECTMMPDGTYVKTSLLIRAFNPDLVPEDEPATPEVVEVAEEAPITEEELDFDEDEF